MNSRRRSGPWLALHLGLGLLWIWVLSGRAWDSGVAGMTPWQVAPMLLVAGWLPSVALAVWQVRHRHWQALLGSDLLGAGALVLLACTLYLPLFFFHVAWFLPLALLPRGVLTEVLMRLVTWRRS